MIAGQVPHLTNQPQVRYAVNMNKKPMTKEEHKLMEYNLRPLGITIGEYRHKDDCRFCDELLGPRVEKPEQGGNLAEPQYLDITVSRSTSLRRGTPSTLKSPVGRRNEAATRFRAPRCGSATARHIRTRASRLPK